MACLCDQCAALCCRYFALPIDNPETARAYDDIRWYLVHENVVVFIEKKHWYVGVLNKCKHLQDDNRCGIYETRPKICREYTTDNCDYHGGEYDFEQLFTSAEQLQEYALEKLQQAREKKRRARQRAARNNAGKQTGNSAAARAGKNAANGKSRSPRKFGRGPILVNLPPGTGRRSPAPTPRPNGKTNGRTLSLPLLTR
jgi:Fe-S-cluster containining protein